MSSPICIHCQDHGASLCTATQCERVRPGPYTPDQCRPCWLRVRRNTIGLERCRYLGAPTGEVRGCQSCAKRIEVPLLACQKHTTCTESHLLPGIQCCRICPDRDLTPAPTASPVLFWPGVPDPLPDAPLSPLPVGWAERPEVIARHVSAFRSLLGRELPDLSGEGDGVLLCGGGRYWAGVVVAIKMLRESGSKLPVQVWYRGDHEPIVPGDLEGVEGVELVDATRYDTRILGGWEIKSLALLHCPWERVLYLDADAYPVNDPAPLLDLVSGETPFAFWVDLPSQSQAVKWEKTGVNGPAGVAQIQGGQLIFHRTAFSRELILAHWLNQHSDYWYTAGYGDQDQWRIVLAATGQGYRDLGPAEWREVAFVCCAPAPDLKPYIVHRCQAKLFLDKQMRAEPRLPGEMRVFVHLSRLKRSAKDVFGAIYTGGLWGHGPEQSGKGSLEIEAKPYLESANSLIRAAGWSTIVDLGCGDGWIASRLDAPRVIGVDVHKPHIDRLARQFPDGREWHCLDIDRDREALPSGDVALVKDVLHHWPSALVVEWLRWARSSGKWRWLVLTQDRQQIHDGSDCPLGGYRALDPSMSPLNEVPGVRHLASYLHKSILLLECSA